MPYKRHTEEQIEQVVELLGANKRPKPKRSELTFAEIAERTGVSPATVTKYAFRHRIAPPARQAPIGGGRPKGSKDSKPREKRSPYREPAFELFSQGKTQAEVTEALGIPRQYTHRFYEEWKRLTDEEAK